MKAVDLAKAGRLYLKAFKQVKDKPQLVGKEWLEFERLFGTCESLQKCENELMKQAPAIKEENTAPDVKVTLFIKNLHKSVEDG